MERYSMKSGWQIHVATRGGSFSKGVLILMKNSTAAIDMVVNTDLLEDECAAPSCWQETLPPNYSHR